MQPIGAIIWARFSAYTGCLRGEHSLLSKPLRGMLARDARAAEEVELDSARPVDSVASSCKSRKRCADLFERLTGICRRGQGREPHLRIVNCVAMSKSVRPERQAAESGLEGSSFCGSGTSRRCPGFSRTLHRCFSSCSSCRHGMSLGVDRERC